MPFNQIRGQEQAVCGLTNSISQGRVAHAYLFIGPRGVGKQKTALAFAQVINALEVKLLAPQGGSIKIEQLRELQREIYLRPYRGKKKLYLIDGAEKMTEEAANSLLKILEEPPLYAIIILLTPYPYSMLPTIRSRCQPVFFQPLREELLEEILADRLNQNSQERKIIARLAQGSMEKALSIVQTNLLDKRSVFWNLIRELSQGKRETFIKEAEGLDKEGREKVQDYLDLFANCYRDILIWQKTKGTDYVINLDYLEDIESLSSLFSSQETIEAITLVQETKKMIKQNVNSRLALEVLFLKLSKRAEEEKCI